jgi:hypothetical protein
MIQPFSSFLSLQKADYAIEVAMYALIVLALGLTALFGSYTPSVRGGTFILVVWGVLVWRRFMTFESIKKWPFSCTSLIKKWEERCVKTLSTQSSQTTRAEPTDQI